MDAVVAESRITLDPRLLGKDVVVLSLKIANDFREAETGQLCTLAYARVVILTLLHCRSDRRNPVCPRLSEIRASPLRQAPILEVECVSIVID